MLDPQSVSPHQPPTAMSLVWQVELDLVPEPSLAPFQDGGSLQQQVEFMGSCQVQRGQLLNHHYHKLPLFLYVF